MELSSKEFARLVVDPESASPPPLEILFEDSQCVVVFKPHRLLIQRDQAHNANLFDLVCSYRRQKEQTADKVYLGMVHRLDRPASGVVVFAKTPLAAADLSLSFRDRKVGKTYEALVEGTPKNECGHLIQYLSSPEEGPSRVYENEVPGTKKAELEYRVLQSYPAISLIEVKLHTGRRHQIRAQLASLGCPILGDGRYGSTTPYLPGSIALVAQTLRFLHPTEKNDATFQLPEKLSSVRLASVFVFSVRKNRF